MNNNVLLDNVRIVLVNAKTPANIGATARCMMNMGLGRLILVNPPEDKASEARKLAAGAHGIIDLAPVCSTLAEAIDDCGLVLGTTRHRGRQRKNIHTPRAVAAAAFPLLAENRVAVVFGNEVNGLENSDLALCHELVAIPSSDVFPSLNLSHAVLIVCYELFLASGVYSEQAPDPLARHDETEGFYLHLREVLRTIGFLEQNHPERMMFSLRQLFGRARLSVRDVRILRGVLSAVKRIADEKRITG